MSRQHVLVAGLLVALLSACKFGKSGESDDRPLPPPEPPAPDAGPPIEPAAPTEAPRRTAPREKPRTDTDTDTAAPNAPAPAATAAPTAGTTPTADAGDAAPAPSATVAVPDLKDKAIACMNKCQTSLSGCMSKPIALDGGMPNMESMAECKIAFDQCRTACAP